EPLHGSLDGATMFLPLREFTLTLAQAAVLVLLAAATRAGCVSGHARHGRNARVWRSLASKRNSCCSGAARSGPVLTAASWRFHSDAARPHVHERVDVRGGIQPDSQLVIAGFLA